MAEQGTKSLIDMGLGTAVTCSFAIPEVGPGIAAVLSTGKMFFDIFYPADKSGQDPLARLPTMADLKNAMNDLKAGVATEIWSNTEGVSQANVIAMSDAIAEAIRNAGAKRSPSQPLPGDTSVWSNGDTVKLFDPVMANPSPLLAVADLIEAKASEKFNAIGLYTLTVSVYLNYCKTAMTWEINENLKDYAARHATWASKRDAHNFWALTKSGPEPEQPGPEPAPPTDGDYAVGSEVVDAKTRVVRDYRSYLGKKKGENVSYFATLAKDQAAQRTTYLNQVIADWSQAKTDRTTYVQGYLDKVTVVSDSSGYHWVNGVTGDEGDPVRVEAIAQAQAAAEQAKLRAKYETSWNGTNVSPDELSDDDIATLKATAAEWQKTVTALAQISASGGNTGGSGAG